MTNTSRWYKGNVHMHSLWSDGTDFPEMIADWFKGRGYHFISFTEHDRLQVGQHWVCTDPSRSPGVYMADGNLVADCGRRFGKEWIQRRDGDKGEEIRIRPLEEYRYCVEENERFLIMTGEEITVKYANGTHYVNALNVRSAVRLQRSERSDEAIQKALDLVAAVSDAAGRPAIAWLNHPNFMWNATAEQIAAVDGLAFMEIHTALQSCLTYGDALHLPVTRIWDVALSLRLSRPGGRLIQGIASDDCHCYHDSEIDNAIGRRRAAPGRAWIMVRAPRLREDELLLAMHRGDFYGSTGVTLQKVVADSDSLRLEIEGEGGAGYTTRFIGTRRDTDLTAMPMTDEQGNPVQTTQRYSDKVGQVLAEVRGGEAIYRYTGDELYVRAEVTSDQPHPIPTVPGEVTKAWTQPIVPPMASQANRS